MQDYRLYFLDEGGKIMRSQIVSVDTDEEACQRAREIDHAFQIEVWQQARKVALVEPHRQG